MKICEIFRSIQGEGPSLGRPAVFIRLSGCNLRCWFCDTKYAWNNGKQLNIEELINHVMRSCEKLIVITGGEPLLQATEVEELMLKLLNIKNYIFEIETNGTIWYEFSDKVKDHLRLIISPKDFIYPSLGDLVKNNIIKWIRVKHQVHLKLVVEPEWCREYVMKWLKFVEKLGIEVYVQPLDLNYSVEELLSKYVQLYEKLKDLDVIIRPQMHKLTKLP